MPVNETRTYPHYGTCDCCAQGDRPLREADAESGAWICEWCDDLHNCGVAAAAEAMQVTLASAARGLDAYFQKASVVIRDRQLAIDREAMRLASASRVTWKVSVAAPEPPEATGDG